MSGVRRGDVLAAPLPGCETAWLRSLEVQLQSQLDGARIVGTGDLAKVAGIEVIADSVVEWSRL